MKKSFWDDTPVGDKHRAQARLAKEAGYDVHRYALLIAEFVAKHKKLLDAGKKRTASVNHARKLAKPAQMSRENYRSSQPRSGVLKTTEERKSYGVNRKTRKNRLVGL
jgi:hypothetical protein